MVTSQFIFILIFLNHTGTPDSYREENKRIHIEEDYAQAMGPMILSGELNSNTTLFLPRFLQIIAKQQDLLSILPAWFLLAV
jgi:hypothetical protein